MPTPVAKRENLKSMLLAGNVIESLARLYTVGYRSFSFASSTTGSDY